MSAQALAASVSKASGSFHWDSASTIIGAVGAAFIAAVVAVAGYAWQQRMGRRDQRATMYAQALQAVEDYMECPYRIRRRDGSAEARRQITEGISSVKSRINFHLAWLRIHAPVPLAEAFQRYVTEAQKEAGVQMTVGWRGRPTRRDRDVPLGRPFDRQKSDEAREAVLREMKADLKR